MQVFPLRWSFLEQLGKEPSHCEKLQWKKSIFYSFASFRARKYFSFPASGGPLMTIPLEIFSPLAALKLYFVYKPPEGYLLVEDL